MEEIMKELRGMKQKAERYDQIILNNRAIVQQFHIIRAALVESEQLLTGKIEAAPVNQAEYERMVDEVIEEMKQGNSHGRRSLTVKYRQLGKHQVQRLIDKVMKVPGVVNTSDMSIGHPMKLVWRPNPQEPTTPSADDDDLLSPHRYQSIDGGGA